MLLPTKKCTKCNRVLLVCKKNFAKHKNGKYGFNSRCKECDKAYNQSDKGKQVHAKGHAKFHQNNPDRAKEIQGKARAKYKQSDKGKKVQAKANAKRWDKHLEELGLERGEGSIGEQKVRQVLNQSNITFVEQHRFNDCKFKYTLPFDFYIPSLNIAIEYDGIQHFETIGGWSDEEFLKGIQERDSIKEEYCRRNNIKLIRIPYWEFDNIETILSDLL